VRGQPGRTVRHAVVGHGYIAQAAVLRAGLGSVPGWTKERR
jgi:hypothetical protein